MSALRTRLDRPAWQALASVPDPPLIGLWADTLEVHALFAGPMLVSVPVEGGTYPALSPVRPAAGAFERAVRDLWGHWAEGGDPRPWFQAGQWAVEHPMSARPSARIGPAEPEEPPPLPESSSVLLSGPVRPGLREPALLRVVTDGLLVESAEARLGYAHKGTALLMRSKSPRAAARFAARIQADSTVAHSIAFARAAEDASGAAVPPRAEALRRLMLAIEAVGACLAEQGAEVGAEMGPALDALRRATATAFGHRLMMDCVAPGGVLADLRPAGADALRSALEALPEPAPGASGFGRACHARAADAAAMALAQLAELPAGPLSAGLSPASGEGLGHAPTPRGTVWHWLRLDNGTVANAFACDPAWQAWNAFAAGLAGQALELEGLPPDAPWLRVSGADL